MVYFYPGLIRWDVDFKLHPWRFFMSTPDFLKPWFIRRWPPKKCFSLMSLHMLHKWWVDITTLQNILKYGWDDQDWQNEHWPEKVRISGSEIGVSPEKMGFNGVDMRLQLSAASLGCFFMFFSIWLQGMSSMGLPFASVFFISDGENLSGFQGVDIGRSLSHWKNWDIGHKFERTAG